MKGNRNILLLLSLFLCMAFMATGCGEEGRLGEPEKTVSILGDSISTFEGVSPGENAHYGQTPEGTPLRGDVLLEDTWWYQAAEELDLRVLVNNSLSGTCIYEARFGSEGAYRDRCVELHCDQGDEEGEEPDLIFVMMGTNDFTNFPESLDQTVEFYGIMLQKMKQRYPQAEIYCLSLLPRREENPLGVGQPTEFNRDLQTVAEAEGCVWVDLTSSEITPKEDVFDQYFHDRNLHPNALGMDVITRCVVKAVRESKF